MNLIEQALYCRPFVSQWARAPYFFALATIHLLFFACTSTGSLEDRVQIHLKEDCKPTFEVFVGGSYRVPEIQGEVYLFDVMREPLPGAIVRLRKLGGGPVLAETRTDDAGHFELPGIRKGLYQLEVCKSGFNVRGLAVEVDPDAPEQDILVDTTLAA